MTDSSKQTEKEKIIILFIVKMTVIANLILVQRIQSKEKNK